MWADGPYASDLKEVKTGHKALANSVNGVPRSCVGCTQAKWMSTPPIPSCSPEPVLAALSQESLFRKGNTSTQERLIGHFAQSPSRANITQEDIWQMASPAPECSKIPSLAVQLRAAGELLSASPHLQLKHFPWWIYPGAHWKQNKRHKEEVLQILVWNQRQRVVVSGVC